MSQTQQTNRRIVVKSRPQGAPLPENFRLDTAEIPKTNAGEVLLRTVYLSLDPYMRGRKSDKPSYAPPVAIGEVMMGGAVCRFYSKGSVTCEHHRTLRNALGEGLYHYTSGN